jgi:hypothetical protein
MITDPSVSDLNDAARLLGAVDLLDQYVALGAQTGHD